MTPQHKPIPTKQFFLRQPHSAFCILHSAFTSLLLCFILCCCNKDDEIIQEIQLAPQITLDSETGIYTVKVGRTLTISPDVENAGTDAIYTWVADGNIIGRSPSLTVSYDVAQDVYVIFRVETLAGTAEEEIKIEVLDLTPPVISLVLPSQGLKVLQNTEYLFAPDIQHNDEPGFKIEWQLDGKTVAQTETYTFKQSQLGSYAIAINAENEDGATTMEFNVEVVETMPYSVEFPTPSYFITTTDRSTVVGRTIYLTPDLEYFDHPTFAWSVDGDAVSCDDGTYKFAPSKQGDYTIEVSVTENLGQSKSQSISRNISRGETSLSASVIVHCYESEDAMMRNGGSCKYQTQVYEFVPAPGQFVNELNSAGYTTDITTHAKAIAYAQDRLAEGKYVSLGGWGGYVIVGFDHSIVNGGGSSYDFAIQGNAFNSTSGGSNEPGIVYVMQDTNGNGLPDDEWYELRGSETGKETTLQDHKVTYYRPAGAKMDVQWTDSEGESGKIYYLAAFHQQDYYYPLWITADSYTLRGTRLKANNTVDPTTGYWANNAYDWGYADNMGSDNLSGSSTDGSGQCNGFKISNAMLPDGTAISLKYIDFIKVQTGTNAQSGSLGENSTEVFSLFDLNF